MACQQHVTFLPGRSGNPTGGRKDKPWRDAIKIAINDGDGLALRRIAEKVVALAEAGDMMAVQEIANRLDGKVPQAQIHMGDEEGGSLRFETVERVVVRLVASNIEDTDGGSVRALPPTG